MKSLSVHLDRLEKVLKAHGIPCKRHQSLEVAAAAFGYHNQNQLTAAGKAGNLNPPMAEPIGEVALPPGETIIVVRDPLAKAAYAIDQAFVEQVVAEERAELFGPTPYGHLLNLSRLLDDQILPLQANLDSIGASETLEIPLFVAEVSHKHGDNLYVMATQEALDAEVADYCRSSLFNDRTFRPGNPADADEDLTKLSDREIISRYFDAPHEECLHTSTDTLRVPLPVLRKILGVTLGAASQKKQPKRETRPAASPVPKPLPETTHPNAPQLIAGIDSVWDDHPDYPSGDWQHEVENGDTRRGYWDWVAAKLEEAENAGDEAEDTAHLPPVHKWCTDDAEGYAGALLYTTNGCCEVAHAGPRLFSKLGLEWSVDHDGFFYPLTEKESRFIGEDGFALPNGYWPHMAYSCLYEGKKFACPTIEVGFGQDGEGDRDAELRKLNAYAAEIRPRIAAIGGHVILEEDEPDETSHTLQVLIPFDYIVQNAVEFDDWKINRMFIDFCERVIDRPELARDPRFATSHKRALHRDELLPLLAQIIRQNTCQHWIGACQAASVPAGRVKSVAEALQSPSVVERGVIERLEHSTLGPVSLIRAAHGIAAQRAHKAKAPPLLGEDTRVVLRDVLGLDDTHIDSLAAAGVVACFDVGDTAIARQNGTEESQD